MSHVTKQFLIRSLKFIAFWLVIGILIYLVGRYSYLFLPFILAFIMTAAISPLKNFLIRKAQIPLVPAVLTAMIVEIGGLGIVITLLVLRLIREVQDIYIHWPFYNQFLQRFITHWLTKIDVYYLNIPGSEESINNTVKGFVSRVPDVLSNVLTFAAKIPEFIIVIVIALVATFFMSKGAKRYLNDIVSIFPFEWRDEVRELGYDFSRAFAGFVRAEFIVFLVTLFLSIVGLLIIHPKYAIMLGTITGIFGILPVLGVGIVLVPWAFIAFIGGHNLLAFELILLTIIITITRHVIEPKILGDNVGLDPLFVLISMYIGLASTGIVGLVLGPFILIAYHALSKAGVFRNL
ncbi:sporulation integral membrane protein YtvI [Desulfosporosinus acidiphilus SJ4]|uniref:Sporulation integral membrane protein YtvI n=1 Tax=Desulfosporosinus acidiphilus (strain DSM 22704 / JCM 16185 / SJ4) TaxID=646529 RepID=I4D7Q1_DESAJ|nr:sporulation integral membrane protein YtvI [Desulfosporosinus acidiphilus]AFM41825.1 sporulation integral membrane protein YtvI [Desulfosporosinus acidiphilus SJ4]